MTVAVYVIVFVLLGSAAAAGASAAPWVPTRARERKLAIDGLAFRGNETVVDLGCGDGAMLFAVARCFPGVRAVGYDISFIPLILAWTRKLLFWRAYRNVHIRFGNLFTADVQSADVIFIFLLGKAYVRLTAKLAKEARADALIAVEAWPLECSAPHRVLRGERTLPVYIYRGEDLQKCYDGSVCSIS